MPRSFFDLLAQMVQHPALALVVGLTAAVLVVNGWTDAPNAIAGAVVTGALPFRLAATLAAVGTFLGVLLIPGVDPGITRVIYSIASFEGGPTTTLAALCAAMTAIVLWGTEAWFFGIPTSESHALVAGLSGAAVALAGDVSCLRLDCWVRVGTGLVLSVLAGGLGGMVARTGLGRLRLSSRTLKLAQLPGAVLLSLLHGVQDGQKFLGILLLGCALAQGGSQAFPPDLPLWPALLCAIPMALGTLLGGRRIIETIGRELVAPGPLEGLSADLGCGAALLWATLLGLPVSTTHVRTAALVGVCGEMDGKVALRVVAAWLFTFPGCFALGFSTAKVFLSLLS